jgi:hypothetical protein
LGKWLELYEALFSHPKYVSVGNILTISDSQKNFEDMTVIYPIPSFSDC